MLFGSVFGSLRLSVRFLVTIIRESMLSIDSSLMLVLLCCLSWLCCSSSVGAGNVKRVVVGRSAETNS
jgi:hypothetical protein